MYLPDAINADLVLDFLKHPDLSYDLAEDLHLKEYSGGGFGPKGKAPRGLDAAHLMRPFPAGVSGSLRRAFRFPRIQSGFV
jgi:hypothetical protein